MLKLLVIWTTVALSLSSVMNTQVWTKQTQKNNPKVPTINSNQKTTNEDVEDIANKLFAKTIKINPNFWLNKNIQTYQNYFNAVFIKEGVLTPDEVQYVSWKSLNISYAGWYWNKALFTIVKDGATATGYMTINADPSKTPQQIATKLENANIKLNYNYWDNKALQNYQSAIKSILVNEKILTQAEITDISMNGLLTITKPEQIAASFDVNDNNTEFTANVKLNVLDDGLTSQQLSQKLANKQIILNDSANVKYEDKTAATNTAALRSILVDTKVLNASEVTFLTFNESKKLTIGKNTNVGFTFMKDGQKATRTVNIVIHSLLMLSPVLLHTYTAEDIASKLSGKTINLNPLFWWKKDLINNQQQLQKAIYKQHILPPGFGGFVKYISSGELKIAKRTLYHACDLNVTIFNKTAIAHNITLNVVGTAQNIKNYIQKKGLIILDKNFWVGKEVTKYQKQFNQVLVQQNVLSEKETNYVHYKKYQDIWSDSKIEYPYVRYFCVAVINENRQTCKCLIWFIAI